jgi:predicted HNH restriction endonuclease
MQDETTIINYGILASIAWNSSNWAGEPSKEDLRTSKYVYVKENAHMHESLNFGHEILPIEDDGYYIGYTPMLRRQPSESKRRNIKIVFFFSSDYKNSNRKSIIGFYGNPEIGDILDRRAKHPLYKKYSEGNIMALPENIIYFENPIIINNELTSKTNLLPEGKKIGLQGFNYLNSDNVYNLIKLALSLNPDNDKLKEFVKKFPHLEELAKEEFDLLDYIDIVGDTTADTIKEIEKLEKKMKNQPPGVKQRVSSYIERGAISSKIKKLCNYKCSVCEALGIPAISFTKSNGEPYVETHHVEPVSTLKTGVLGITNLMTVCANHHRQLHYGSVELIENTEQHFTFLIDGVQLKINKIVI